ncbi:hypothetical protein KIPB_006169 [Kipferlia bialata]|uniref:DUSP domain-containing protein n=1 Tax=Kipferlia bialata TaxID=797122 RepID=A0A9K3CZS5_9EUKA|nr:hypothetical protein KIPB_006169 [Kipferlia bialata]|eukprot:g6169.t1
MYILLYSALLYPIKVDLLYGADTVYSDVWFLMSESWLQLWRDFVSHGSTSEPPGPIDNSDLVTVSAAGIARGGVDINAVPREGRLRLHHYRGVSPAVYKLFHGIYGGGPAIVRASIDLYGPPLSFDSFRH